MNVCPKCDHKSDQNMNFCGMCGHAFAVSESSGRERRQVTVLFSDIVDFTRYAASATDDDVPEVLEIYQGIVKSAVSKHQGYIAQFLGDGVMVYFGYPSALENATERAIRAGLDIINTIKSMTGDEYDLKIRVGIHHGSGVITNVGGEGRLLVGNTPNVAARMQTVAEPNTLVISEPTYQATRGLFDCINLGEKPVKGLPEPLSVFQVIRHKEVRRFDIERQKGIGSLAGRKTELAWLADRLTHARSVTNTCVLIRGDAGIGKSRLLYEFEQQVSGDVNWFSHRCSAYRQDSAYLPIQALLNKIINLKETDEPASKLKKVNQFLEALNLSGTTNQKLLTGFLSLSTSNGDRPKQAAMDDLLVHLSSAAAGSTPLVIVIEDAHWVDQSTLDFLKKLLSGHDRGGLMVIVTARPSFNPKRLSGIAVDNLVLEKLDEKTLNQIVEDKLGDKVIRAEVPDFITSKANGNPFFVEELTRTLIDTGVIVEKNGQVQLDQTRGFKIPETLNDTLANRVDQLGYSRFVAQVAAVLGREFEADVLGSVLLDQEQTIKEHLEHLKSMGIIDPLPNQKTEEKFLFRHDLIRDAIYESMVRQQREMIHRNVAYTLETLFSSRVEHYPELLALHWEQANEPIIAIEYYRDAGVKFTEQAAHREAISHCRAAIELVREQPASLRKDRIEFDLLLMLGASMNSVDGYASQEKHTDVLEPALKLSEKLKLGLEAFPVVYGLWSHQLGAARKEGSEAWRDRLTNMLTLEDDAKKHMWLSGQFAAGTTDFWQAKFSSAIKSFDEVIHNYDKSEHALIMRTYGEDPGLYSRLYRQWAYLFQGRVALAQDMVKETNDFSMSLDDPLAEVMALAFNLHITRDLGRVEETLDIATRLISRSEQEGYPYYFAVGYSFRDWCYSRMGRHDETFASADVTVGGSSSIMSSAILRDHAEVSLAQGDPEKAMVLIEHAELLAHRNLDCLFLPDVLRVKAEALNQLDNRTLAMQAFRESLSWAERWGERYWHVKTATSQLLTVGDLVADAPEVLSASLEHVAGMGDCEVYSAARSSLGRALEQ